jgi:hypothetical protein
MYHNPNELYVCMYVLRMRVLCLLFCPQTTAGPAENPSPHLAVLVVCPDGRGLYPVGCAGLQGPHGQPGSGHRHASEYGMDTGPAQKHGMSSLSPYCHV